jgi:hypothetical protein
VKVVLTHSRILLGLPALRSLPARGPVIVARGLHVVLPQPTVALVEHQTRNTDEH